MVIVSLASAGACPSAEWAPYQSSLGSVKSMSVVASELGVGSLKRRVSVGLGLLDTVDSFPSAFVHTFDNDNDPSPSSS